jgi:ATP-binding cassette subfamily D (ALD) protein 3
MHKKLFMGVFDSMLVKYGAVMVGYSVLGLPVFGPGKEEYLKRVGTDSSAITRDYIRNSSLLINLAKAIGRLVISYKEVQQLAGFTTLVYEMKEVLRDLETGKYTRTQIVGKDNKELKLDQVNEMMRGKLIETEDFIRFTKVPVASPNGDVFIKEVSFEVRRGVNTVVTGPNGCGKSSLFRILSGLWPLAGGVLERPNIDKLFYIPQRPYLPPGTLRDQVIYPQSKQTMQRKGLTDDHIRELLRYVRLDYIEDREGGFDSVNDWADVLSGGEKQRMAMARLFYHRPLFAILDECTSAVSMDVEAELYNKAKQLDITLFTVTHRSSLFKFHDYKILLDGDGGFFTEKITH